jgi:hypothetical protein
MSADDPKLLEAFDLGDNHWPPDPNEGHAVVKFSAEYEVDEQKPAGKDDPTVKNKGRKARKFTAELHWTLRIDSEARAYIKQVSPVGANQGKAWEIVHPDAELYNVDNVEILTMGEIARTAGERTLTIGGISWIKKPPVKVGTGTKSADKAVVWSDQKPTVTHVIYTTPSGNKIDMGAGPVTIETPSGNKIGFDQPENAPSAKVPL